MTAFKKMLVSILAVSLLAGVPAMASGGTMPAPDCPMSSAAGGDDGCCGGEAGMSGCDIVCATTGAAVVPAEANAAVVPESSAVAETLPAHRRAVTRPPDTAPPKPFFA